MSYIVNGARLATVTVNGVNYTDAFLNWNVTDASAFKNGAIVTTGTLTLGTQAGTSLESYRRDLFKRGQQVILTMTDEDGVTFRHPRGLLYVVDHGYSPEAEQVEIQISCKLGLAALTNDVENLIGLSPIPLDVTQQQFSNISAAFTSAGQYIYQDNNGSLQTGEFFAGDSTAGTSPGEWLSIDSVTSLSVTPLAGSSPVPDTIQVQYQIPKDALAEDNKGYIETVQTISQYFVDFPGVSYQRVGTPDAETPSSTPSRPTSTTSDCGNSPPPPPSDGGNDTDYVSCSDQFETVRTREVIPATKTQVQTSYYDGPAGQLSRIYTTQTGLGIEVNQQYYADKYAYCRALYASQCQPNGGCPMEGITEIPIGSSEVIYYYGAANELVKTVQDTYALTLSVAQPIDWRARVANPDVLGGVAQFQQNLSDTDQFLIQRVVTEYYQEGNANVQFTTTYTSVATQQTGITSGADLNALAGVKTTQKRISTTTATIDVAPDRVNTPNTDTIEKRVELPLLTGRYVTPPSEAGPYVIDEAIPVPVLFDTEPEINAIVDAYSNYITRMYKGDAFGLQIGEVLRTEIASGWRPGMPFRFYDASKDEVLALRMDATNWNVSGSGALLVTSGLWVGFSNGSISIPSNVVGNSAPDLGGGSPTPPPTPVPPSIVDETYVDSGSFAFTVDVDISTGMEFGWYGEKDGILAVLPTDNEFLGDMRFFAYCTGFTVEPGSLVDTGANGHIPIDREGNLLTATATIVVADVFAAP